MPIVKGVDMQSTRKMSIVRVYALVFGIAYLGVALLEVILGSQGLHIGGQTILRVTPAQNAIHWLVGAAVLGSFFAGNAIAKLVARTVGGVFVLVTVLGFSARNLTGHLLGFHGPLPWSYNIVHLATAVAALFAGFAAEAVYTKKVRGSQRYGLTS
jgi:hypothetical protein